MVVHKLLYTLDFFFIVKEIAYISRNFSLFLFPLSFNK